MALRARQALDRECAHCDGAGRRTDDHLPAALEFVAELPDTARLVWKTNTYGSAEARELLDGMSTCGWRISNSATTSVHAVGESSELCPHCEGEPALGERTQRTDRPPPARARPLTAAGGPSQNGSQLKCRGQSERAFRFLAGMARAAPQ
jgi:hypothetical protein